MNWENGMSKPVSFYQIDVGWKLIASSLHGFLRHHSLSLTSSIRMRLFIASMRASRSAVVQRALHNISNEI